MLHWYMYKFQSNAAFLCKLYYWCIHWIGLSYLPGEILWFLYITQTLYFSFCISLVTWPFTFKLCQLFNFQVNHFVYIKLKNKILISAGVPLIHVIKYQIILLSVYAGIHRTKLWYSLPLSKLWWMLSNKMWVWERTVQPYYGMRKYSYKLTFIFNTYY